MSIDLSTLSNSTGEAGDSVVVRRGAGPYTIELIDIADFAGGGGGASVVPLQVTVPNSRIEYSVTEAFPGMLPTYSIGLMLAAHADTDENGAEMLDIRAMSATAGTDTLTIDIAFGEPTAGLIRLNMQVFV